MIYFNPNHTVYSNLGYSRISSSNRGYGVNRFDSIYNKLMKKAVESNSDTQSAAMFAAALTKSMQLMALQSASMTGYRMNSGMYQGYNHYNMKDKNLFGILIIP